MKRNADKRRQQHLRLRHPAGMPSRILLISMLVIALQGCLLELALGTATDLFARVSHGGHAHTASPAPAHHHDDHGREADFCCDNTFTLLSHAPALARIAIASISFLRLEDIEESTPHCSTQFHSHSAFLLSSISGSRDKYALSCLLHAPPATKARCLSKI